VKQKGKAPIHTHLLRGKYHILTTGRRNDDHVITFGGRGDFRLTGLWRSQLQTLLDRSSRGRGEGKGRAERSAWHECNAAASVGVCEPALLSRRCLEWICRRKSAKTGPRDSTVLTVLRPLIIVNNYGRDLGNISSNESAMDLHAISLRVPSSRYGS
jgi:hypothetical protein